ncbi:MAG: S8 family serine peptidase [Gallionellaceae bacterium]|jgi:subtilisin family serine protease
MDTASGIRHALFILLVSALALSSCSGGGDGNAVVPVKLLKAVSVTPVNPATALNSRLQLTATGTYSDNTTQNITTSVIWSSSDTSLATVGINTGLVIPVAGAATGTVMVTATSGALSALTTITLTAIPGYSLATITDPLPAQQWSLRNTGQNAYADTSGTANTGLLGTDTNVDSVYSTYGYTGWGVTLAVIDTGLEIAHEDLSTNVVPGGSWNFVNSTTNPTNTSATTGDHGTSVSGLIAMAKNSIGGIGVAPTVSLKGFNFLAGQSTANSIASLGGSSANPNSSDVAIFNQSYGTSNITDVQINTAIESQYADGVSTLRGGKGALYVKSAGNGFMNFGMAPSNANCTEANNIGVTCQNANFDPNNTLSYNTVVAALNAKGKKSSYSTAGSAIWVSAPGGEYGYNVSVYSGLIAVAYDPALVTTDQSGCTSGYSRSAATTSLFNQGGSNHSSINLNCNYTNSFNGTSAAAPMMSGVIALILEANPALTWREVKDILARTAVQVDASIAPVNITSGMTGASVGAPYVAEQGWTTNAAGFKFHNWYGFGAVNANAAVTMARTYTSGSLGAFTNTGWISSSLNSLIADNSTSGVSVPLTVPSVGTSGKVETVQIKVTTTNTLDGYTGDLGIELTSPSGTKSILKNIKDGFSSSNLAGMVLASNAFYGETSTGTWTIKVVDGWVDGTQTLTNVQIRVYGH